MTTLVLFIHRRNKILPSITIIVHVVVVIVVVVVAVAAKEKHLTRRTCFINHLKREMRGG